MDGSGGVGGTPPTSCLLVPAVDTPLLAHFGPLGTKAKTSKSQAQRAKAKGRKQAELEQEAKDMERSWQGGGACRGLGKIRVLGTRDMNVPECPQGGQRCDCEDQPAHLGGEAQRWPLLGRHFGPETGKTRRWGEGGAACDPVTGQKPVPGTPAEPLAARRRGPTASDQPRHLSGPQSPHQLSSGKSRPSGPSTVFL